MIRLEMKNYNTILISKLLKYQPYHQAKLISMNIYLTGEEILPSNQKQIIEKSKFTYSPLVKAFEKQIKKAEDQGRKQVETIKDLKAREQTKATKDKSDDNPLMSKKIYYRLLSERMDEVLKIRKKKWFKKNKLLL